MPTTQEATDHAFNWIRLHVYERAVDLTERLRDTKRPVDLTVLDEVSPDKLDAMRDASALPTMRTRFKASLMPLVRQALGVDVPIERVLALQASRTGVAQNAPERPTLFIAAAGDRIAAGSLTQGDVSIFQQDAQGNYFNVDPTMTPAYGDEYPYLYHLGPFVRQRFDGFAQQAQALAPDIKSAPRNAYAMMDVLVADLAERYPQAGLSFGYIGNLSRHGDDRSWSVFTKLTAEAPGESPRNLYWGASRSESMEDMLDNAQRHLEGWVREQLQRRGLLDSSDEAPEAAPSSPSAASALRAG